MTLEILRDWFDVNRPLVWFIYGQVFFILGLAIAMRSRQYSRLKLARSLPWLAGFGFLHGLNEWGDLFIPIQSKFLNIQAITILETIQLILLAISFTFLFQFGIELFLPLPEKWGWVRFLPMFVFFVWLFGLLWSGLTFKYDLGQWQDYANATARYGICFPGGLVAAYGLLKQDHIQIEPLGLPKISRTIKIAAGALIAYSFLAGIVVPRLPIFPASLVNVDVFTYFFIGPPPVFRSIAGAILTFAMIRAMDVFDIETERMITHMEETQIVAIERERIARDLHDGALQQVYAAGLLAQSLRQHVKGNLVESVESVIISINEAIDQLRAFLPQLQPEVKYIELISALKPVIEEARLTTSIQTSCETPISLYLSPEQINHLVAFTREAISNAIRHAQTPRIELQILCKEKKFSLIIRDFGRGLVLGTQTGYGMRNMRDRARLLEAEMRIDSTPGKGTTITLDLPTEELNGSNKSANC